MSTGPKKHLFWKSVGAFVVFCVAFELVLRLFGYGNYTIYRPDPRLMWVPEPGHTVTVVNHLPITINHQGLRYAVDLAPKQNDQFRIITLGDSAVQGWGVDDNSHFSAILEKQLNHGSCSRERFQVVTGGVNAYPNSLVAEKLKLLTEDEATRPDVFVVAVSGNSNFEGLTKLQGAEREKFLRRVELKSIVRRSAIYNFLIEDLLRKVAYYKLRHAIMAGTLGDMEKIDMNQFRQNLQDELDICNAHHVQLVFMVMGVEGQKTDAPLAPLAKAMVEFAAQQHVPVVNTVAAISAKDPAVMYMDPEHPTIAGNEVIAGELKKVVENLPNYAAVCDAGREVKSAESTTPGAAVPVAAR